MLPDDVACFGLSAYGGRFRTSAEHRACARQDQSACLTAIANVVDDRLQLEHHHTVQPIAVFGPVECNGHHRAVGLHGKMVEIQRIA